MNDVALQNQFSVSLRNDLESVKDALPDDFNIPRFVQNSLALVQGNETLDKFGRQYGPAQIKAGLIRGAYLGLDALNQEMYLVPYKDQLQFMPSYKGMTKLVRKYSPRKVKSIYAKLVRDGDEFEEVIVHGEPSVNFNPMPFNDAPVIGAFAICLFEDGGAVVETMSKAEIETCHKQSRAQNSPAWSKFWGEMAKKTVIRRLCKSITLDMDAETKAAFEAGTEIETDAKELAAKDISENQNSQDFVIDGEMTELDSQMTEVGNGFEQ